MTPATRGMIGFLGLLSVGGVALLAHMVMTKKPTEAPAAAPVARSARRAPAYAAAPPPSTMNDEPPPSMNDLAARMKAALPPLPALPPPSATAPAPAAPSGPGPQVPYGPDKELVESIWKKPVAELKQEIGEAASRHPGVVVRNVACIDRPCQAQIRAHSQEELDGFLKDVSGMYGDHVNVSVRSRNQGEGEVFRADLTIGSVDKGQVTQVGPHGLNPGGRGHGPRAAAAPAPPPPP